MAKLITRCPSCGNEQLDVCRIECGNCSTTFEGSFTIPVLLKLSPDEMQFVKEFILCSGSLKAMSKIFNVSYPTMRIRLDQLISKLKELSHLNQGNSSKKIESGKSKK